MKKFCLLAFFCLCTLSTFAIDPLGSRVDFDDDYSSSNNGGFAIFWLIIGVIGWAFYAYMNHSVKKENEESQPKSQSSSSTYYEDMIKEHERRKKEEDRAAKGCIWG